MITCLEHTYFTCWRQQHICIYVWCISVDILSDLLVADRPNKAIALSWSLIPHTSLNKWWLPWHVMTIRRQLLGHFPRPKFAGCNAASIQKQGKCWSREKYFNQGSDFINPEEKNGSVLLGGGSNACRDPHQGRSVSLVPTNGAHHPCELGKALGSSCHTSRKQQEYTRVQIKRSTSRRT